MKTKKMNDTSILDIFLTQKGKINPHKTDSKFLNKHIDIYNYLANRFKDSESVQETIYRIKNGIEVRPICPICGKPLKFQNAKLGFRQFCSVSCSKHSINEAISVFDKNIILNDLIENGKLNKNKLQTKYLKEHGYFEYLISIFKDTKNLSEKLYRLYHNLNDMPLCLECHKHKALYLNFDKGYDSFCSSACQEKYNYSNSSINDQTIIDLIYPNGNLSYVMTEEKILKNYHIYNYILNRYSDSSSIRETIYRIKNGIEVRPICPICGNPLKFIKMSSGFEKCCSIKCLNEYILTNELPAKAKITDDFIINLFNPASNHKKDNLTLARNGILSYLRNRFQDTQNPQEALYRIQHGLRENPLCPICGKPLKFKQIKNTYGSACSFACSTRLNTLNNYKSIYGLDLDIVGEDAIVKNQCQSHSIFKINRYLLNDRLKDHDILCPICNPISISSIEKLIIKLLEKNEINYILHDRKQIYPYELDFYLPDFSIAIECNGIYWHSEVKRPKEDADFKYKLCKSKNIRLLTFWEDEILDKLDIVEDIILSSINRNRKIYARQCLIKPISYITAKNFLQKNNLYAISISSIRFGLFYQNQLVQIATFKQMKNKQYELQCLCSKLNYNIVGGCSKLLSYFKKSYEWDSIIAFCKKDISYESIFEKLGFQQDEDLGPDYNFYNGFENIGKSVYVPSLQIHKCWNSGNFKYILKNN